MNMKKIEKWLLLEQTGELSPKQLRCLNRVLAESERARALREDLDAFRGSIHKTDVQIAPWAVAKISARLQGESPSVAAGSRLWKPALALAAGVLVMAGVFNFHGGKDSSASADAVLATVEEGVWDDPYEEDLSQLESLIVAMSSDPIDIMEM